MKSLPQRSVFVRVCVRAHAGLCLYACVHLSILVGVGDKAVLQHHCVYKASVCCLLLLITAQHNVSAQLAMHKILCVYFCACVRVWVSLCACVRERLTQKELGAEWVKMRKMKSGISSGSRFVFLLLQ